jgi:aspartate racemase
VQANVYQPALESRGIRYLLPDDDKIDELTRLSFEIKSGNKGDEINAAVLGFAEDLIDQGADAIVSGCTEYPLVLGADDLAVPLLSSTDELAKRTIALARGDMPLPQ